MKEDFIRNEKLENSLIVIPEQQNIFSRFFKWISSFFGKKENQEPKKEENIYNNNIPTFTIPDPVKMPIRVEDPEDIDENSLEYLYKLEDQEINDLNILYNEQMEEAKGEIEKLDKILDNYKKTIKKMQGQLTGEGI